MVEFNEIQFIAVNLGIINEILESKNSHNIAIAQKYMNILQDNGCKLSRLWLY